MGVAAEHDVIGRTQTARGQVPIKHRVLLETRRAYRVVGETSLFVNLIAGGGEGGSERPHVKGRGRMPNIARYWVTPDGPIR